MRSLRELGIWGVFSAILAGAFAAGCGQRGASFDGSEPVKTANGSELSLVAINDEHTRASWLPDGTPREWSPRMPGRLNYKPESADPNTRSIILAGEQSEFGTLAIVLKRGQSIQRPVEARSGVSDWRAVFECDASEPVIKDVSVGIADCPWSTVSVYKKVKGKMVLQSGEPLEFRLSPTKFPSYYPSYPRMVLAIRKVPKCAEGKDFDVVLRDWNGEIKTRGSGISPDDPLTDARFDSTIKLEELGSFELRMRDYSWVQLGELPLERKART
jgi:hypothetical protein